MGCSETPPVIGLRGPKNPFFVKMHTLVYAKMTNMPILGLLDLTGYPVESLLYVYFKN